jgi:predicted nucleotidyltransferase
MEELAERLAAVPGVVAVALGGSRATGRARPESDWDFGLYYRGAIRAEDVRALGFEGTVVEPGEWGRLMNGGAWLTIDGVRVDLLYRDLDFVEHWTGNAERGIWERDQVEGYLAGMPTYALAGELAIARVLAGSLPRLAEFPAALRRSAPPRWHGSADFSLMLAEVGARRGDAAYCTGLLARAAIATAHARLAERGEWALNEKGIVERAGLGETNELLAAPGELPRAVDSMRSLLATLGRR